MAAIAWLGVQFLTGWGYALESALIEIESGRLLQGVAFETGGMTGWDNPLITFLAKIKEACVRVREEPQGRNPS